MDPANASYVEESDVADIMFARMQKAEVANLLEASRQHVLQVTADELRHTHRHRPVLLRATAFNPQNDRCGLHVVVPVGSKNYAELKTP